METKLKYIIPYKYREIWYKIRNWINPRQKWLIKKIPNDWKDKDTILRIVIFECVKHYIECEEALEILNNENPPEQKKFIDELKEVYQMITVEIPMLEKEVEEEWKNIKIKFPEDDLEERSKKYSYKEMYGKIDELEELIDKIETKIMLWAVNNRHAIWT